MSRPSLLPLFLVLLLVLSAGCRRRGDHFSHDSAREAAERIFACLVEHRYGDYVMACNGSDSMPQAYRSQLEDMAAQFMDRQQKARGGILSAASTADTLMPSDSSARVYMDVVFADSQQEQISLCLLFRNGRWKLR